MPKALTPGHDPGHSVLMSRQRTLDLYERLFRASVSQFRNRGYSGASVSHITQEVGVAKGTFFNYFHTKEHVLSEAFSRWVEGALGEVETRSLSGTDAILSFCVILGDKLSNDRVLAEALVLRLSALPAPEGALRGLIRNEERVRNWIEARLAETLRVSVPLIETDSGLLAFLVTWAFRGTLEEWLRGDASQEALRASIWERVGFLLESAGLPAQTPEMRAET